MQIREPFSDLNNISNSQLRNNHEYILTTLFLLAEIVMQNSLNMRSPNAYQFSSFQSTSDPVFHPSLLPFANITAGQLVGPDINNVQGIQRAVI